MSTTTAGKIATTTVIAEDAPIGVLTWPVVSPEFEPNYTLQYVETVRTADHTFVRWVYESGNTRVFRLGESITIAQF